MQIFNIHDAKTHLSRLLDSAVNSGDSFVIAKSGKPMATVTPYQTKQKPIKRIGFMDSKQTIPDDFDEMNAKEISELFMGNK